MTCAATGPASSRDGCEAVVLPRGKRSPISHGCGFPPLDVAPADPGAHRTVSRGGRIPPLDTEVLRNFAASRSREPRSAVAPARRHRTRPFSGPFCSRGIWPSRRFRERRGGGRRGRLPGIWPSCRFRERPRPTPEPRIRDGELRPARSAPSPMLQSAAPSFTASIHPFPTIPRTSPSPAQGADEGPGHHPLRRAWNACERTLDAVLLEARMSA